MKIIKKKIWPEYFEAIKQGRKKFELRLADFYIEEDDILFLEEWDPEKKEYTSKKTAKKVTSVSRFKVDEIPFWSKEDIEKHGLQIISLN